MFKRELFNEDHEAFCDMVRRFVHNEIAPYHAKWEESGVVPRELWLKAGAAGMLCVAMYGLAALTGRAPRELPKELEDCDREPRLGKPIPVGDGAGLLRRVLTFAAPSSMCCPRRTGSAW